MIANYIGCEEIEHGGTIRRYRTGGVECSFAREMIAQGSNPGETLELFREGTKVWAKNMTLEYWAGLVFSEGEGRLRRGKWTERPAYWTE